jgi:hypothetical protein
MRSYGDLVINVCALSQANSEPAPVTQMISAHLRPLWEALAGVRPELCAPSIFDAGIDKNILRLFTYKHLANRRTLTELLNLRCILRPLAGDFYLERADPRNSLVSLVCRKKLKPVHESGTVYQSFFRFYGSRPKAISGASRVERLVIFPDSRLKRKEIPVASLTEIKIVAGGLPCVACARFSASDSLDPANLSYSNFEDLVKIVRSADFIVTSDSLPAHLAQLFGVPHWIVYNGRINHEWLTPFAEEQGTHSLTSTPEKLLKFLSDLHQR